MGQIKPPKWAKRSCQRQPGETQDLCYGEGWEIKLFKRVRVAAIKIDYKSGYYPVQYKFAMITQPPQTGILDWISNLWRGSTESPDLTYEDSSLAIAFSVNPEHAMFQMQNRSSKSITLDWNQIAFIDETGKSHKVLHSGVKYADMNSAQPPTLIPPGARVEDVLFPTDYVNFTTYNGWKENPLLPSGPAANSYKGKTLGMYLPINIGGEVRDYRFTFRIDSIESES